MFFAADNAEGGCTIGFNNTLICSSIEDWLRMEAEKAKAQDSPMRCYNVMIGRQSVDPEAKGMKMNWLLAGTIAFSIGCFIANIVSERGDLYKQRATQHQDREAAHTTVETPYDRFMKQQDHLILNERGVPEKVILGVEVLPNLTTGTKNVIIGVWAPTAAPSADRP